MGLRSSWKWPSHPTATTCSASMISSVLVHSHSQVKAPRSRSVIADTWAGHQGLTLFEQMALLQQTAAWTMAFADHLATGLHPTPPADLLRKVIKVHTVAKDYGVPIILKALEEATWGHQVLCGEAVAAYPNMM